MKLIFTDYYIFTFLRISPDACEDMCASLNTNFKSYPKSSRIPRKRLTDGHILERHEGIKD